MPSRTLLDGGSFSCALTVPAKAAGPQQNSNTKANTTPQEFRVLLVIKFLSLPALQGGICSARSRASRATTHDFRHSFPPNRLFVKTDNFCDRLQPVATSAQLPQYQQH